MVVVTCVQDNTTESYSLDCSVYVVGVYQSMKVAKEKTANFNIDGNFVYTTCKLNKEKDELIERFSYYE